MHLLSIFLWKFCEKTSFWARVLVIYQSRWSCNNEVVSFLQISQNLIVTSESSCCPCLVTTVFIDIYLQRPLKVSWSLHDYVTSTLQINFNFFDVLYISCCPNVVTIALDWCLLLILLFKFGEHNHRWERVFLLWWSHSILQVSLKLIDTSYWSCPNLVTFNICCINISEKAELTALICHLSKICKTENNDFEL